MLGSEILEVAIGIVFVFLLVSILCSALREGIEALLKTRAAYLERGIRELLHDTSSAGTADGPKVPGLASALYNHPLIYSLYAGTYVPGRATGRVPLFATGRGLPSYVPSRNFAVALMDIAARGAVTDAVSSDPAGPTLSLDSIRQNVQNLGSPAVQRVMLMALDTAEGDVRNARATLEAWFDSGMDRVSGWYKRSTYWIVFWIGLVLAVGLNVDAITIGRFLYANDAARAAIVARAQTVAADTAYLSRTYRETKGDLGSLGLPIGWPAAGSAGPLAAPGGRVRPRGTLASWITEVRDTMALGWPVLGWLCTALAATLGAPFWFDVLNKVMVIRSTVKPHEKSPEESSEDRQRSNQRPERAAITHFGAPRRGADGTGMRGRTIPMSTTALPSPRDAASSTDGCNVATAAASPAATLDEELPPSAGGVA